MVYIPKEIEKDGITLYLINVEWYTQTTKKTGEIEIADLYRGEAYYKGVKKINNPSSYKIVAGYTGKATKKVEKPYVVIVKYEEIIKEKQNIVLPITVGTISSIIVVVVLFFNKRSVKVFNLQYGKYKYLGKLKIKKLVLNLDNINKKAIGDKYKFVLNNYLLKKYKNCNIEVKKGDVSKKICITKKDFEIKM